ncbi:MAG TPA: alpha/beta fold hydrolase [Actinophytocola sp.]|uniref:alpha/beta fold hydrolase n=1 Tax=Actinophytocola sp. TaxID=1872138 RepID=UPI002DBB4D15|nr:alpha/beta fold hydrolase [Actinophytocola sp.]HEU5469647.1 alpha/beta fold hydrolase [Actinophytocola sp.]
MNTPAGLSPLTRVPFSETALPRLDQTIPPWPGEERSVGDLRLHVRRTPGPTGAATAVYVHGLGGSATNWTDLAAQLSGQAPGLAVDLPGFGRSEPMPGFDFSLTAHAEVLARFLRGMDLGPVHLFGNSMGGAISMLYAAEHPELVRSLTLVSPAVPDLRPSLRRLSDARLPLMFLPVVGPRVRHALAAMPPRDRAMQLIRLCFADPTQIPEARLAEATSEAAERAAMKWAATALARSAAGLFKAWLVPPARSLWTIAPRLTMPTLVIWGTEDKLVTVRKAPRLAKALPRARLLVLPRTGHVAQMERPVTVARAVLGMWEAGDAW